MKLGKNTLPVVCCVCAAALHGICLFFSVSHINSSSVRVSVFNKDIQALVLVILSLCLSAVLPFQRLKLSSAVFVIKTACLIFVCMAAGTSVLAFEYLLTALVIELSCYVRPPAAIPISAAVCAASAVALLPHYTDNVLLQGISFEQAVFCILFAMMASVFITLLCIFHNYYIGGQRDVERLENAIRRITDTNLAWQNYAAVLEEKSVEKERQRISREIHDIIGYTMTNLLMLIQAAQHCGDEQQLKLLLQKAQSHINESVNETRLSLRRLRDSDLYSVRGPNLFVQLTRTFAEITGIAISIDFGNVGGRMGKNTEKVIYRMLQEGLTNSFRHGKASSISVSFWADKGKLTVRILDNGVGVEGDTIVEGIGIQGMRERLKSLGGGLTAGPVAGGFAIQAIIPENGGDE